MQIKTQLKQEDGKRLDEVIRDYKFKSKFELAKALLRVYVKANDPKDDEILCENLKDIFYSI